MGITQGRGKLEKSHQGKLPQKYVLLYPLVKDFKEQLCRWSIYTSDIRSYGTAHPLRDSYLRWELYIPIAVEIIMSKRQIVTSDTGFSNIHNIFRINPSMSDS